MQILNLRDFVDMTAQADSGSFRVDLAYARADNLLFGEAIYRPEARLWLHKSLAQLVLKAAGALAVQNLRLILYDGLRTTDAQQRMLETARVRKNPHWLEEPRLLSPPGAGAHPRGMAIDVALETPDGALLDMGTPFDFLAANPAPDQNPAHRDHPHLSAAIRKNRTILDEAMQDAADQTQTPLFPLPQEWWDYRLPPALTESYAPLSDADLPEDMRMCCLKHD